MTKLIVAFCSFSNVPKIYIKILKMMRFNYIYIHTHTHIYIIDSMQGYKPWCYSGRHA